MFLQSFCRQPHLLHIERCALCVLELTARLGAFVQTDIHLRTVQIIEDAAFSPVFLPSFQGGVGGRLLQLLYPFRQTFIPRICPGGVLVQTPYIQDSLGYYAGHIVPTRLRLRLNNTVSAVRVRKTHLCIFVVP